ncbi:hypothetical protein GQ457_12G007100 [Hibiscus cannabinus]
MNDIGARSWFILISSGYQLGVTDSVLSPWLHITTSNQAEIEECDYQCSTRRTTQDIGAGESKKSTQVRRFETTKYVDTHRLIEVTMRNDNDKAKTVKMIWIHKGTNDHFWKEQWTLSNTCCFRGITPHINFQNRFIFPTSRMVECRIILAEQDNLLTLSELQDRCHLSLRRLIGLTPFFFPTSKMEKCRIILTEQDNLLTFSESQERCHLGLRRLIGSRLSSRPPRWDSAELS